MTTVRPAHLGDLAGAAAIYDEQVRTGISTFDLEPPPEFYWRHRLESPESGDQFLVAEDDEGVVGFAYATSYRPRPAYRLTRETSVYLTERARGSGLGRRMYDDLLSRLRADEIHVALALVALPNPASVALHLACGFEQVGTMREVGRKFDRWIDTAWYQLTL